MHRFRKNFCLKQESAFPCRNNYIDVFLNHGRGVPEVAVKQGFRISEVAKLTELTLRQLDHWDRTGFIRPSLAPAAGRGSARFYSFRDVVQLRVAKELRDAGIPLQALRRVVERIHGTEGLENPLAEAKLVVNGRDVLFVRNQKELMSALDSPGQGVLSLVLDLPQVVRHLRKNAESNSSCQQEKEGCSTGG